MIKKHFLWMLLFSLPVISLAETDEIKRLQEKCNSEQASLLKDRNGTPSCDQLNRIIYGNRIPTENTKKLQSQCEREQSSLLKHRNGTPSCDQLNRAYQYQPPQPTTTVIIPESDTLKYWHEGTHYCGHTPDGKIVHCY